MPYSEHTCTSKWYISLLCQPGFTLDILSLQVYIISKYVCLRVIEVCIFRATYREAGQVPLWSQRMATFFGVCVWTWILLGFYYESDHLVVSIVYTCTVVSVVYTCTVVSVVCTCTVVSVVYTCTVVSIVYTCTVVSIVCKCTVVS